MSTNFDTGGPTRALSFAALAGFAVMVAAFIPSPLRLFTYFESAPQVEIQPPPPLKMAAVPPRDAFAEITARPIFNQDRRPDPAREAPTSGENIAQQAGDLSQFRIVGIVTDREVQLALVQTPGGTTTRVRAGDTIDGWRIEKVDVSGVTASDGMRSARLVIPRAPNGRSTP
jgi:hypothetical protein